MTDKPQPPKPASPVRKTAARAAQAGVNVIWIVPIIALVVTLAIAWNSFRDRGTLIDIEFADATGITPGDTTLRFREIVVGQVEGVRFTDDLSSVVVSIRVDKDVAPYIDDEASFWIVRPQVSAQGVTRLDTVLTGAFIEGYWDADISETATRFAGLERPPLIRSDQKGTWVKLLMDNADGLSEGAPILFRGVEVGRLENIRLADDSERVRVDAFIEAPHDARLTSATVFWDTSGFSLSLGSQGLAFNVNSLSSVLQGGVAFDTLISGGQPIETGHSYELLPDEDAARSQLFVSNDSERLRVAMLIDDSVEGLGKGADVQYKGLRIGSVTDIAVRLGQDSDGVERVQQLITLTVAPRRLGLPEDATAEDALDLLQTEVASGLRARVASSGFLGTSLVVELVNIPGAPEAMIDTGADPLPLIPSVAGDLDDFTSSAQGLVTRIGDLPIEEVMNSARDMLDSITALAASEETRAIPGAIRKAAEEGSVALEDVAQITARLREADSGESLARLIDGANEAVTAVTEAAADMPEMVDQIDVAAAAVEEFGFAEISAQAEGIMADLRAMLGSEDAEQLPRNLSDTLEAATGLLNDLSDGGAATSLNDALRSASVAADEIARSVEALPALIQSLQVTAGRADTLFDSYGERSAFNNELITTLRELRRATAAFGSVARLIERNPRAFILGR
ncbi:MlaD family protein [Paracoccus sp. 1_MG-2023]|uniref:PqiB family protein n=1 Tax=unclassified Paracoccus (in: a-proteobacteria) TaxID=2688777 RepID=UPI001C09B414|nr:MULTISPECIES: MlaD family protein [unclassified Paracoccus (in: a-proteobacteria)]MBU2957229.1 MCE family protein [Paracoccus sp. C2R09]MDO6669116.1 MlaD family protein [Paracoccus sp. 1_MG-2023]